MNGHAVETASHLIENDVRAAKEMAQHPAVHNLDASKLTITLTKSPSEVPAPRSIAIWEMKTPTVHSKCLLTDFVSVQLITSS
jgi:branched-chain amino acid aminotransferase